MSSVAVVILNWNNAAATIRCASTILASLENLNSAQHQLSLVIVDNGSHEREVATLSSWSALQTAIRVQLVLNKQNLGFSAGMNCGIELALNSDPGFIWLLNNDTAIEHDAISHLLAYSEKHPDAAIVGSTILDFETGKVKSAAGYRYWPWLAYSKPLMAGAAIEEVISASPAPHADYIDGAAIWLRADFVRRIDGLPTNHFLYFEELELNHCLYPSERLGWCRSSLVYHLGSGSATSASLEERATYHAALSAFRYTGRHFPWFLPSVMAARILGIAGRAIYHQNPGLLGSVFQAVKDFLAPTVKPHS